MVGNLHGMILSIILLYVSRWRLYIISENLISNPLILAEKYKLYQVIKKNIKSKIENLKNRLVDEEGGKDVLEKSNLLKFSESLDNSLSSGYVDYGKKSESSKIHDPLQANSIGLSNLKTIELENESKNQMTDEMIPSEYVDDEMLTESSRIISQNISVEDYLPSDGIHNRSETTSMLLLSKLQSRLGPNSIVKTVTMKATSNEIDPLPSKRLGGNGGIQRFWNMETSTPVLLSSSTKLDREWSIQDHESEQHQFGNETSPVSPNKRVEEDLEGSTSFLPKNQEDDSNTEIHVESLLSKKRRRRKIERPSRSFGSFFSSRLHWREK